MEHDEQQRVRPSERFAGDEHLLDLSAAAAALRREEVRGDKGHRQIALVHEGPVRLVLFAFESGGHMKEHAAPGWVTVQVLRGNMLVRTADALHHLTAGTLLSLAPRVRHDVEATEETDMLLGIYPEIPAP
ncbi:MAG: AraC family ligand binding domain-containing protein [Gemmatimonadaceae bacterium]